jgi:hypothetical protein
LAAQLTDWAAHPDRLARARQAALDAARTRWNAEREAGQLVAAVGETLETRVERRRASGE